MRRHIVPRNPFFYQKILTDDAVSYVNSAGRQMQNVNTQMSKSKTLKNSYNKDKRFVIEYGMKKL